jgi:general secretion pathway protein L
MVRGMQVGEIWKRWLDGLAAVLLAARELWRAQRTLVGAHEDGALVIRQGAPTPVSTLLARFIKRKDDAPTPGSVLASVAPGARAPDDIVRAARGSSVLLELPAHELVVRHISVPVQAREFLSGIVRNRIDRISPWQAEQALYGFEVSEGEGASALDITVAITSRIVAESAQAEFEAMGLPLDRIVARPDAQDAHVITLWSRLGQLASGAASEQTRRQIGMFIAAALAVSVVVSVWTFWSAGSMRSESEELAARSSTLQRKLQGSRASPSAIASLGVAERAWVAKESAPSAVVVIEALSRALPDSAYLTELRIEGTILRMVGLTEDAPSLIAPLERSGYFGQVRFAAPSTRGTDGSRFRFHIEGRVLPRLDIPEN